MKCIGVVKRVGSGFVLRTFTTTYKIISGKMPINTYLTFNFQFSGKSPHEIEITDYNEPTQLDMKNAMSEMAKKAESLKPIILLPDSNNLIKNVNSFSQQLAKDLLQNKFFIVRFNNDTDGISGGLAMSNILGMHIQHNSPIYSTTDAEQDIIKLRSTKKGCVMLIDFGSNEESLDAIMMLNANKIGIRIIDHHPIVENVKQYATVLNSWEITKTSDVTAGYLAAETARRLNLAEDEYATKLAKISLAGDKSPLLHGYDKDNKIMKIAACVDYLITYSSKSNTFDDYERLIFNEEALNTVYELANEKKEQIIELLKKYSKLYKLETIKIVEIPLEKLKDFKSKSKICNLALEAADELEPVVIIGYSSERIIFRINKHAIDTGIRADNIIEKLKNMQLVETGGGHSVAATINYNKKLGKLIIKEILSIIKDMLADKKS